MEQQEELLQYSRVQLRQKRVLVERPELLLEEWWPEA